MPKLVSRYPITLATGVLAILAVAFAAWLWPRADNVDEREVAGIGAAPAAVRDDRVAAAGERMVQNLRALERANAVFGQQTELLAGAAADVSERLARVTALLEQLEAPPGAAADEALAELEAEMAQLRSEVASLDSATERIRDLGEFLEPSDFRAAYDELATSAAAAGREPPARQPFPVVLAFVLAAALLTFGVAYVADRKIWQAHRPGPR